VRLVDLALPVPLTHAFTYAVPETLSIVPGARASRRSARARSSGSRSACAKANRRRR
jgi:hypothetical protein